MNLIDDLENIFHSFKSIITSKYFLLFQEIIEYKINDNYLYSNDSYENFLKKNKLKDDRRFTMYYACKTNVNIINVNTNYSEVPIFCLRYLQLKVDKLFPFLKRISNKRKVNIHDVIIKVRILY